MAVRLLRMIGGQLTEDILAHIWISARWPSALNIGGDPRIPSHRGPFREPGGGPPRHGEGHGIGHDVRWMGHHVSVPRLV
jgi:hypothetical protein